MRAIGRSSCSTHAWATPPYPAAVDFRLGSPTWTKERAAPADYAGVDLFQAFALLLAGSVALLTGLVLLVVSRKALRDRRESKSVRRRRHYRT